MRMYRAAHMNKVVAHMQRNHVTHVNERVPMCAQRMFFLGCITYPCLYNCMRAERAKTHSGRCHVCHTRQSIRYNIYIYIYLYVYTYIYMNIHIRCHVFHTRQAFRYIPTCAFQKSKTHQNLPCVIQPNIWILPSPPCPPPLPMKSIKHTGNYHPNTNRGRPFARRGAMGISQAEWP